MTKLLSSKIRIFRNWIYLYFGMFLVGFILAILLGQVYYPIDQKAVVIAVPTLFFLLIIEIIKKPVFSDMKESDPRKIRNSDFSQSILFGISVFSFATLLLSLATAVLMSLSSIVYYFFKIFWASSIAWSGISIVAFEIAGVSLAVTAFTIILYIFKPNWTIIVDSFKHGLDDWKSSAKELHFTGKKPINT
jgi:hypothetical protein